MPRGTLLRPICDAGASRSYTPTEDRGSEKEYLELGFVRLHPPKPERTL